MATPKTFDAVEMSRRLREETSRKLSDMTREERLALLNSHLRSPANGAKPERLESSVVREEPPQP